MPNVRARMLAAALLVALFALLGMPGGFSHEAPPQTPFTAEAAGEPPLLQTTVTSIDDHVAQLQRLGDQLVAKAETLSGFGSQYTGRDGNIATGIFLAARLQAAGYDVTLQPVDVVVPSGQARLEVAAGDERLSLPVYPLRPNTAQLNTLREPVDGELIYLSSGDLAALDGLRLQGRIALMETAGDWSWLDVFRAGVKAVVFIEPEAISAEAALSKEVPLPANLPRFWLSREDAEPLLAEVEAQLAAGQPGSQQGRAAALPASLIAEGDWQRATAFNVVARISPGDGNTDVADEAAGEPPLMLAAAYDAPGLVPDLTPGGHELLNAVTLLHTAETAAAQQLERPLIVAFLTGHHQAISGMRAVVGAQRPAAQAAAPDASWLAERLAGARPAVTVGAQAAGLAEEALGESLQAWLRQPLPQYDPSETLLISPELSPGSAQLGMTMWSDYYLMELSVPNVRRHIRFAQELLEERVEGDLASRAAAWEQLLGGAPEGDYLLNRAEVGTREARFRLFQRYTVSPSEVYVLAGGMAFNMGTEADAKPHHGTPLGTVSRVLAEAGDPARENGASGLANLVVQADVMAQMVGGLLTTGADLWPWAASTSNQYGMMELRTVRGGTQHFVEGRTVPLPETLILAGQTRGVIAGVETPQRILTDENGRGFHSGSHIQYNTVLRAYHVEPGTGKIQAFSDQGSQLNPLTARPHPRSRTVQLPLFLGYGATLQGLPVITPERVQIFDRITEAPGVRHHADLLSSSRISQQNFPWLQLPDTGLPGLLAAPRDARLIFQHRTPGSGETGGIYISKATADAPQGDGIFFDAPQRLDDALQRSAIDLWLLNEVRLETLRSGNLRLPEFDAEHRIAQRYLEDALAAAGRLQHSQAAEQFRLSLAYSEELEPSLVNLTAQSILNLLLFLTMTLFFGYFTARILISRRLRSAQWAAAVWLVLVLHLLLRASHPAYLLTEVPPEMLLFAFGLLTLVGMACIHWWRKGEYLVAALRRKRYPGLEGHEIDSGALGGITFDLALTNLGRRRVRSTLTVVSLAVFAFAVLSSVALSPTFRYTAQFLDNFAPYDGFMVQEARSEPLPDRLLADVVSFYEGRLSPVAHRWHMPPEPPEPAAGSPIADHDIPEPRFLFALEGRAPVEFQGLLGMGAAFWELERAEQLLVAGGPPDPGEEHGVMLPLDTAQRMGGTDVIGQSVTFIREDVELGPLDPHIHQRPVITMTVTGIFDDDAVRRWRDLNGRSISPIGVLSAHLLITDEATLEALGEPLRAATFIPAGGIPSLEQLQERVVPEMPYHFYVGIDSRRLLLGSSGYVLSQTTGSLAIILVLGMLITLNTMLGGVYERVDELRIFGIVGMAPKHIFLMMLAEAVIFVVLGLGLGWILFQAFFALLAVTGWLPELTLNPGAFTIMLTMLLLSGTVLASAYVPASQAARLTAPIGELGWRLPWSGDKMMSGQFPFMVRRRELKGLLAFLWVFLEQHTREGFRSMTVRRLALYLGPPPPSADGGEASVESDGSVLPGITFQAHVAPYDLGVIQQVIIYPVPEDGTDTADDHQLLRMCYTVIRENGDPRAWHRTNKDFLSTIRRQLLVWQDMSEEDIEQYQHEGETLLDTGSGGG